MYFNNYTYDARNQLIDFNGLASFAYDHDGRRISATAGVTTNYLWDEFSSYGDVVLETGINGTRSYTLAAGMLISQTDTAGTLYFLPDAQGSTRALTDTNGSLGQTFDYDAFGNLQGDYQSGLDTNYLYTGQQYDVISELYSLRARYYDPSLGRFLSVDTWAYDYQNPVELNRYVYTANNPATYVDPSGQFISVARIIKTAADFAMGRTVGAWIGASVGASIGAIVGTMHAALTYDMIAHGDCGSRSLKGSYVSYLMGGMAAGIVGGAIVGAGIGGGPIAKIVAGSVLTGYGLKGAFGSAVELGTDLRDGNGFNWCAAVEGAESVLALYGGMKMLEKGVQQIANDIVNSITKDAFKQPLQKEPIDWRHTSARKANQAARRGWTNSDIQKTVEFPAETLPAPRGNMATGNSATIYYRSDGHYVILDSVTGDIVQVSNTLDFFWIDEGTGVQIRSRP